VRLAFARCDRKGAADSRPVRQFVQHPRMDGGLLTDSESIGEVKKALAGFPGWPTSRSSGTARVSPTRA
jgi:hypothetical protein